MPLDDVRGLTLGKALELVFHRACEEANKKPVLPTEEIRKLLQSTKYVNASQCILINAYYGFVGNPFRALIDLCVDQDSALKDMSVFTPREKSALFIAAAYFSQMEKWLEGCNEQIDGLGKGVEFLSLASCSEVSFSLIPFSQIIATIPSSKHMGWISNIKKYGFDYDEGKAL